MLVAERRNYLAKLRRNYGKKYNDGCGHFNGYAGRGHWKNKPRWRATAKTIASYNPVDVLDLGCGRGALVTELRRLGVNAVGCDFGDDIKQTKWAVAASALELPFKAFDTVLALDIIEHLPADFFPALFTELRRITDRLLIATVPTAPPYFAYSADTGERNHYVVLPPATWAAVFNRGGFRVAAAGAELEAAGPPFCYGADNFPFILKPKE